MNGKIYKLVSDSTTDIYIGSTCNTLSHRLSSHKAPSNKAISKELFKTGKVEIILIENFPCSTKDELRARERFFQTTMDCINKNIASGVKAVFSDGKKEWMQEYRVENKDKIQEQDKFYNEANKDKIKLHKKDYRDANKDKIKVNAKEYRESHKDKIKEYQDANKEKMDEYNKEYYEANKDKIKVQTKEYRDSNLETIQAKQKIKHNCYCGGKFTNSGKSEHFKTAKHLSFQFN